MALSSSFLIWFLALLSFVSFPLAFLFLFPYSVPLSQVPEADASAWQAAGPRGRRLVRPPALPHRHSDYRSRPIVNCSTNLLTVSKLKYLHETFFRSLHIYLNARACLSPTTSQTTPPPLSLGLDVTHCSSSRSSMGLHSNVFDSFFSHTFLFCQIWHYGRWLLRVAITKTTFYNFRRSTDADGRVGYELVTPLSRVNKVIDFVLTKAGIRNKARITL